MRQTKAFRGQCFTCLGAKKIPSKHSTPELPLWEGCPTCHGADDAVWYSDHYEFAVEQALKMGELTQPQNGNVVNVNQQVAVLGGGKDVSFRMYGEGLLSLVRGCLRNIGCGTFILSPVRIFAIIVWLTCAFGAFRWAGGLKSWPAFALTAMFVVQMGVLFRQVGSFGWVDALLYPVHLLFITVLFVLGIFSVRVSRRVHWRGRSVRITEGHGP